ncbi:RNA splicing factor PRP9 [Gautieria morchelliformis]|nr:RNA splicing factor PRP9 [Gautieria morchelliformis]
MDTVLDLQRQTHEEIERFERALATVLSKPHQNHQVRLTNEHKAAQILERITSRATTLSSLYNDEQARNAELALLSTPQSNGNGPQDELAEFYSRLVKIKEHHHKYPDSVVGGFELELSALVDEPLADGEDEFEEEDPISLLFSGEEAYGRYLDLYANHSMYNNLRHLPKRLSYLQYLDLLLAAQNGPVHRDLPQETRMTKEFESYLTTLHSYLLSFTKRTQPLTDIARIHQAAEAEFDDLWEKGKVDDWDPVKRENGEGTAGIWCTACQKQYSKQTVYDAHLKSKKHTKAIERQAASGATALPADPNGAAAPKDSINGLVSDMRSKYRTAANLTHLITTLLLSLSTTLAETKSNVERRFSLTARERELELEEAAKPPLAPAANGNQTPAQEDEEEEEKIYNPLKLPLGWDGKPIPYWLYKLHGLGVEYRCEICSDHVYMGRKNFDRHFQESRHAFGMRALGLPNTKHFHEITRIEDALSLAEKLKQEGRQEIFQQETMEELEDDEGNVYNKKTYDDLKKQGLI